MNNFTLTDYEEYLTGVLTKRPGRVRFATTSSIFLADLTGLAGSDLSCLELGSGFELECLVSEARSLTVVFGLRAECLLQIRRFSCRFWVYTVSSEEFAIHFNIV